MKAFPVEFLYLDSTGIESLYSQLDDMVLKEMKKKAERAKKQSAEIKPTVSLGGVLAKFGLAKFDIEGSLKYDGDTKTSTETTRTLSSENKLVAVIKRLQFVDQLHDVLDNALQEAIGGRSVYALFEETFKLDHWSSRNRDRWIEQANTTGMLTVHLDGRNEVIMGMSLAKT